MKTIYTFCGMAVLIFTSVYSRENTGIPPQRVAPQTLSAGCDPGTSQMDLDINNVRTTVLVSGDMWWDLFNPKYEIPKGTGKHSMFSGSLWIGGIDAGGQLKVAAMTYRQSGNDFWPGPLDNSASISPDLCKLYDKHYKVTRKEVEEFTAGNITATPNIINWPGNGPNGAMFAPFIDVNGNMVYEPMEGDYPGYNLSGAGDGSCTGFIYGDETIWWVFNDRGNIHTESGAESIGLEIQAQAFAFNTNDEINDMTFYQYKIINRSTYQLNNTYFGQWVDPDLGYYKDDYVGCDVPRGLGYCYNADNDDDLNANGYGLNPPAIGVDFFRGPEADKWDDINNDRDSLIDEPGEQIIMSKFVYYNNDGSERGNPENASDIYGYLRGYWKDGTPITYGGNGYSGTTPCDFMFPGNSDHEWEWGTGGQYGVPPTPQPDWYESIQPDDRRFLQTAGSFTLKPGAVNFITTGVVWARATSGGAMASVELLRSADDKAQALFNNCFKLLDGPDAPDLTLQEMDKQIILYLSNAPTSNNVNESYSEMDPTIITPPNTPAYDNTYDFEGYQIYQLKEPGVSVTDLHNPDKARQIAQVDLKNFNNSAEPIGQLVNFYFNSGLNANVPVEEVNGENKGILHSFSVTQDAFATGDPRLVNHKEYYYMVVAYAYNQYKEYDQNNPLSLDGQKKPYLRGRRNVKTYTAIPHIPAPEFNGTIHASGYGLGPELKRVEGQGNGGMILDLTDATVNEIMNATDHRSLNPVYQKSKGPVKIKVVDPLNVPLGDFTMKFDGVGTTSNWSLKNETTGLVKNSERTILTGNEQLIPEWGMSVWIEQVPGIGSGSPDGGFLEGTLQYTDPTKQWLSGVPDVDGHTYQNWIRSGRYAHAGGEFNDYNYSLNAQNQLIGTGLDDEGYYEKILGGTWAPYRMCSRNSYGPAWSNATFQNLATLSKVSSVDIILTPDKSKWTRCAVLEMSDDKTLSQGNAEKHWLRNSPSVNKEGNPDGSGTKGLGWFPGYAINVETGERLNIAFGENSFMTGHNGRDMKWNPNEVMYEQPGTVSFGGQHYIYVFGHNMAGSFMPRYDSAAFIHAKLSSNGTYAPSQPEMNAVYRDAMWVGIPLLVQGRSVLETEVKIRLRVSKPYKTNWAVDGSSAPVNNNNPMYTFSTKDLRSQTQDAVTAEDALALINVVPNPYYGYSSYEKNATDTRIKITNLPMKCKIRIYTLSGTLVRTITRDDETKTSVDWDMKNEAGIPVASGMYIIHVEAEGIGEKILKWFGAMRPQDLGTF